MTEKITGKDELHNKKQNNDLLDESSQTESMQPLIIKQASKNPKGTKSLPYNFGSDTYSVYSNLNNPFMVGILNSDTDTIQLDPIKTQSLFQQIEKKSTYSIDYPLNISAHKKRKITSTITRSADEKEKNLTATELMIKNVSSEYLPKEKLKEDKRRLSVYIDFFFENLLKRLGEHPEELPEIVNELVTLFVENKIRIRFYKAFHQIRNLNELIKTLKKISDDCELENFELFCSALFVFYCSKMS
tara:strand:+ start:132 stop:866 length:735 start_codon:yes stop_codon:yes gene_type:complete